MAQFPHTPTGGIDDMLDNVSEMLLRTNPKLTTNLKLITNGNKIWMESYSANATLSDSRYKSVCVSPLSSYNKDLIKFYDGLEATTAYKVIEEYDNESVKDNYAAQYESFYWAGCERIDSLEYDEDLGIVAPLWISGKLPDMFVVFRVDNPAISLPSQDKEFDFREDILEKCTIVRTFDLTENTPIGKYIRNYASSKGFPKSPLTLSLDPDTILTYNGISYKNGEFTSADEHCHELLFEHDDTILSLDKHITQGFERNGIVCANLINMEFLFDDNEPDNFTINRYFGLYCNAISDADFELDTERLQYMHNDYKGNPSKFSLYEQRNLTAENPNGVEIPFIPRSNTYRIPQQDDLNNLNCVFCVKDINNSMHDISKIHHTQNSQAITLTDRELKLNLLKGLVPLETSAPCTYENEPISAQVSMTVNRNIPTYTKISLWQTIAGNTTLIGELVSSYMTDENDTPLDTEGWYDYDQFYGKGTTEKIAEAICNSFNATFDVGISAYRNGSTLILSADNPSSTYETYSITIGNCTDTGCITMPNGSFRGACNFGHLVVAKENIGSFTEGDYVRSLSRNGYARITAITINTSCAKKDGRTLKYNDGLKYNVLTDYDVYGVTRNNTVETFREFVPSFCRMSFFPVKDFNCSTYGKSVWGEMGELDYEKALIENITSETESDFSEISDIQPLETVRAEIGGYRLDITLDSDDDILPIGNEDSYLLRVEQIGDPNEETYEVTLDFVAENTRGIESEYNKITKTGFNFSTLSTSLNRNGEVYIDNEYTRCYENYATELMLLSKTQPWICKWVTDGGTDVRDNPYRLNTNQAFGQLSFSPDHRSFSPDTNLFNQEWGYIFDRVPERMTEGNDVTKIWSYIGESVVKDEGGTIYDNNLERNLKSPDKDWFDTYFKRDYLIYGDDTFADTLDHIRKYTLFRGGTNNVSSSTFFMGAKIELIEKADWTEQVSNNLANIKKQYSGNMDGYRFTSLIVPVAVTDATAIGDIKTKVIRNDIFRFVVILVYVVRQYNDAISVITDDEPEMHSIAIDTINRYVLYSPQDNVLNVEHTNPIIMTGTGRITRIEQVDNTYTIHGENTNFTNDFIPYTDHNVIDEFEYKKQLVVVRFYTPNGIKKYSVFTIKDVISDTEMTAELDETAQSQNPYDTYSRLEGAHIPLWHNDTDFYGGTPPTDDLRDDTIYFIANCDYAQFASALNRCVFGSIFHDINVMQKENVVYELIDKNGAFHTSDSTYGNPEYTYALMFVRPKDNAKYEYLTMRFNGSTVDYAIHPNDAFPMFRHGWDFTPHRTEILKYKDPYIENITSQLTPRQMYLLESSRHKNTCFASDYNTFGKIYNLLFHRANDRNSNVFRLKEGDKPLYPVDNKFAIGSRTYNVFNSPWDKGHYTTTLSEISEADSHGTLSMKEHKSFLSTTAMKTPDTIKLETFVPSEEQEDLVTCICSENNGNVTFDLLVEKRLIQYFTEHLTPLFREYIAVEYSYGDKTTIDDDIEAYIRQNILPLYQLEEINFYVRETTSNIQTFDYSFISQPDNMKKRNGLAINKTFGIRTTESNFDRHITFNTKPKRAYSFGLSVKITRR